MGWENDGRINCDGMCYQCIQTGCWEPMGHFSEECGEITRQAFQGSAKAGKDAGACKLRATEPQHWMCPWCAEASGYHGSKGDPQDFNWEWTAWRGSYSERAQWGGPGPSSGGSGPAAASAAAPSPWTPGHQPWTPKPAPPKPRATAAPAAAAAGPATPKKAPPGCPGWPPTCPAVPVASAADSQTQQQQQDQIRELQAEVEKLKKVVPASAAAAGDSQTQQQQQDQIRELQAEVEKLKKISSELQAEVVPASAAAAGDSQTQQQQQNQMDQIRELQEDVKVLNKIISELQAEVVELKEISRESKPTPHTYHCHCQQALICDKNILTWNLDPHPHLLFIVSYIDAGGGVLFFSSLGQPRCDDCILRDLP
jgi:chemotaxis protein histidine kinase CheA